MTRAHRRWPRSSRPRESGWGLRPWHRPSRLRESSSCCFAASAAKQQLDDSRSLEGRCQGRKPHPLSLGLEDLGQRLCALVIDPVQFLSYRRITRRVEGEFLIQEIEVPTRLSCLVSDQGHELR